MKKMYLLFYVAVTLCLISCSDQTTEKSEPAPATPASTTPPASPVVTKDKVEVSKNDTPRTEISIGQNGGSIKTKKGTGVSVDGGGIKVGSKDIKVDIRRDSN